MSIYAANGKEPIAAWIPSLDTAGNGTATLTDSVGSLDGTLTNMDVGTDWVADTDAGGVRAVDLDGINDFIAIPGSAASAVSLQNDFTLHGWFNARATNVTLLGKRRTTFVDYDWHIMADGRMAIYDGSTTHASTGTVPLNQWNACAVTVTALGAVTFLVNGTTIGTSTGYSGSGASAWDLEIGDFDPLTLRRNFNGRLDDIRIFATALDTVDVADLYTAGRGGIIGGGNTGELLRRGNRMGFNGVPSHSNPHIARGIRMAQMGAML